jgi:hypothetical protein
VSDASQAREARKLAQAACAWRTGGPQIAASAFRRFRVFNKQPITTYEPIEHCQYARLSFNMHP